jgi:hypothetical protein
VLPVPDASRKENAWTIGECAEAPAQYHYDEEYLDVVDPSPCAACNKYFNTKRHFFVHLKGGPHHWRNARYVKKRKAENELNIDFGKEDERLAKWIRKDMVKREI